MTTFVYKAKKDTAETVTGEINADNQDQAIDLINQLGLLPVSIEPQLHEEEMIAIGRPQKVNHKDLYIFSRQLANLLKSGVSILRGLNIISEQTQSEYFKAVILNIAKGVKNGRTLCECLAEYPHIFSSLYITMINAGEESGNLQEMLVNVSEYQKKQEEIRSKVRTALVYPILMALVGAATVYFILTFVLPKMAGLFDNIGQALPLPTTILLNVSNWLYHQWFWMLVIVLGLTFSLERWRQSPKGRTALSTFTLSLPLFGKIILKSQLARFCRTLVLLLKSGVSIINALSISIPMLSNELIKKDLTLCNEELTAGGSLGQSLKESSSIAPMMGHLIAIGEESGNLNEVLNEMANTYEMETNEQIKIMTTLLEPLMILAIGLVVGFIVFAMLLPIFQVDALVG